MFLFYFITICTENSYNSYVNNNIDFYQKSSDYLFTNVPSHIFQDAKYITSMNIPDLGIDVDCYDARLIKDIPSAINQILRNNRNKFTTKYLCYSASHNLILTFTPNHINNKNKKYTLEPDQNNYIGVFDMYYAHIQDDILISAIKDNILMVSNFICELEEGKNQFTKDDTCDLEDMYIKKKKINNDMVLYSVIKSFHPGSVIFPNSQAQPNTIVIDGDCVPMTNIYENCLGDQCDLKLCNKFAAHEGHIAKLNHECIEDHQEVLREGTFDIINNEVKIKHIGEYICGHFNYKMQENNLARRLNHSSIKVHGEDILYIIPMLSIVVLFMVISLFTYDQNKNTSNQIQDTLNNFINNLNDHNENTYNAIAEYYDNQITNTEEIKEMKRNITSIGERHNTSTTTNQMTIRNTLNKVQKIDKKDIYWILRNHLKNYDFSHDHHPDLPIFQFIPNIFAENFKSYEYITFIWMIIRTFLMIGLYTLGITSVNMMVISSIILPSILVIDIFMLYKSMKKLKLCLEILSFNESLPKEKQEFKDLLENNIIELKNSIINKIKNNIDNKKNIDKITSKLKMIKQIFTLSIYHNVLFGIFLYIFLSGNNSVFSIISYTSFSSLIISAIAIGVLYCLKKWNFKINLEIIDNLIIILFFASLGFHSLGFIGMLIISIFFNRNKYTSLMGNLIGIKISLQNKKNKDGASYKQLDKK